MPINDLSVDARFHDTPSRLGLNLRTPPGSIRALSSVLLLSRRLALRGASWHDVNTMAESSRSETDCLGELRAHDHQFGASLAHKKTLLTFLPVYRYNTDCTQKF
jgi:hypothetical protein